MKNKTKKIALPVFAAAGVAILATGCAFNKPPTAEALIAGAYPEDMHTTKGTMELAIDISASAQELGLDGTMDMSMNASAEMKSDKDTTKMDGSAEVKLFGMTINQPMKEYSQVEGDKVTNYSYSEDMGWTYTIEDYEEESETERELNTSVFKDLALQEPKKEDTEYIVTATMDLSELSSLTAADVGNLTNEMDGVDYDDVELNTTITFDKTTKYITGFTAELANPYMQDGTEITKMVISVKDLEFSNDNIEVPADVIREANEETRAKATALVSSFNNEEEQEESEEDAIDTAPVFENAEVSTENTDEQEDFDTAQAGEVEKDEETDSDTGMEKEPYICEEFYGKDFLYEADLIELAGGRLEEGDEVNYTIIADMSFYSKNDFLDYVSYWQYFEPNDKLACAYITDFDIVTVEEMIEAGADSEELKSLIKSIQ